MITADNEEQPQSCHVTQKNASKPAVPSQTDEVSSLWHLEILTSHNRNSLSSPPVRFLSLQATDRRLNKETRNASILARKCLPSIDSLPRRLHGWQKSDSRQMPAIHHPPTMPSLQAHRQSPKWRHLPLGEQLPVAPPHLLVQCHHLACHHPLLARHHRSLTHLLTRRHNSLARRHHIPAHRHQSVTIRHFLLVSQRRLLLCPIPPHTVNFMQENCNYHTEVLHKPLCLQGGTMHH
jgi:hypothetical protein